MDWTDEYREIVEFYYWEPQHIGRVSGNKRFNNADEMYSHVNSLEVSLNHVLNIFFSLYDIHKLDCFDADASHTMMSAWQLELLQREQHNATQPDLFFQGKDSNLAIELKLDSKSSKTQIIKYIEFNNKLANSSQKSFILTFLTPQSDISKIFKEKYTSLDGILTDINKHVRIRAITYRDLYESLQKTTNNETEAKLVNGLLKYLNKRPELKIS